MSPELKENLVQSGRNIGNNLRTLPTAIGLLGWASCAAGCIMIWHHYYASTESSVIDNAVTNYYVILALMVPILNLFAFLTEVTIVHYLALGIFFTNFAQFCATADFYTRADHGSSLAGGYSLLLCGEILSFFAIQEFWRNFQAAKDRIREFAGLFSFIMSILLVIGCVLMFYDSEQYSLMISIPPLLIAEFYMLEHLFSVLGLKYVVVTLTAPGAYYILSSALIPDQDSQWKSGAAVAFISLIFMNVITVYRSIGSEDSKWREKYYLCVQTFFENIRKVIPMAALGIGFVTAAIGTILLYVQSARSTNLATDHFLFASMMMVPALNFVGYLINVPLLHFTAVGLYYMAVGPYLQGGTTVSGGSWQIDYLLAWIGATISFIGNLEAYKKFAVARERLVESVFRHPAFLLSCITAILILIGVIILFFVPEHGLLLLIDMDPLVLGAVYLIHAFVGITGIDYVLMFWAGCQLHANSLVFALNSYSKQLQVGFSLIFIGLVLCFFVLTYKKIRIPDEAEHVPSNAGYEEL